jgi:hypothetical protein
VGKRDPQEIQPTAGHLNEAINTWPFSGLAVEVELEFDPLVDDADIHVVNINGDVALNGTVPSYPQYLEATW